MVYGSHYMSETRKNVHLVMNALGLSNTYYIAVDPCYIVNRKVHKFILFHSYPAAPTMHEHTQLWSCPFFRPEDLPAESYEEI